MGRAGYAIDRGERVGDIAERLQAVTAEHARRGWRDLRDGRVAMEDFDVELLVPPEVLRRPVFRPLMVPKKVRGKKAAAPAAAVQPDPNRQRPYRGDTGPLYNQPPLRKCRCSACGELGHKRTTCDRRREAA